MTIRVPTTRNGVASAVGLVPFSVPGEGVAAGGDEGLRVGSGVTAATGGVVGPGVGLTITAVVGLGIGVGVDVRAGVDRGVEVGVGRGVGLGVGVGVVAAASTSIVPFICESAWISQK